MAVMFDGVDKLQHQAWRFIYGDEKDGAGDEYFHRMRGLCMEYFSRLDSFIERLWNLSGQDTRLFIASDHGFTTTWEVVRINVFLERKGYLKWKEMPDTEESLRRENSMFANLDWENTTAYCRTPSSNGITIRVAGKDGQSGISPGDYESFREKLISDLKELRDEDSGERIIRHIYRREEVFPGEAMRDAPDLLLVLRDYGFVSIKNREPVVERRHEVAGTHHPEGIFMGYGRGIRKGVNTQRHNIVDVTSGILYSLGVPVPNELEGKIPEEFFERSFIEENPPVYESASAVCRQKHREDEELMEAEKDKLMDQLKMLGYME
jgi:predicted AlkP superfamily phosphohydrolase/phosphomutase